MAREDARGTAKSLRELKQERDAAAEERSRNNRGRNGEQGRSKWVMDCSRVLRVVVYYLGQNI